MRIVTGAGSLYEAAQRWRGFAAVIHRPTKDAEYSGTIAISPDRKRMVDFGPAALHMMAQDFMRRAGMEKE